MAGHNNEAEIELQVATHFPQDGNRNSRSGSLGGTVLQPSVLLLGLG